LIMKDIYIFFLKITGLSLMLLLPVVGIIP